MNQQLEKIFFYGLILLLFSMTFSVVEAGVPAHCDLPNLLLVIDTSGSMTQSGKLESAQNAIINTITKFKYKLRFGLIHFSNGRANLDVQIGPKDPKDINQHIQKIINITKKLKATGDTPMTAAIRLAKKNYALQVIPNDKHHQDKDIYALRPHFILLLTDGMPTDGDPSAELVTLRSLKVDKKIYDIKTYFVGLGSEQNIQPFLLNQWAKLGGTGGFYHATKKEELSNIFMRISTDVSTQQEKCNGIDDNCNGQTDENLQKECQSICGIGIMVCHNGVWGQCNASRPQQEVCDGHDNDCDGQIDEGLQRTCKTSCGTGQQECINGDWSTCNAPTPKNEVCNGTDDDCDGIIDNDNIACPTGKCITDAKGSRCDIPCKNNECPAGFFCNIPTQQCLELPCRRTICAAGQICINKNGRGICKDICKDITCPIGQTCGRNGTCINCYEQACPPQMVCKEGHCVIDKCASTQCGSHQGCSDGVCFDICADKQCPQGQRCQTTNPEYPKSVCFADACAGIKCPQYHVCIKGSCVYDRCLNTKICGQHQLCDPKTGLCSDNPCQWTHCPPHTVCIKGECKKGNPKTEDCPSMKKGQCCTDANCGSNFICKNGFCLDKMTASGQSSQPTKNGCSCNSTHTPESSLIMILLFYLLFGFWIKFNKIFFSPF